MSAICALTSCTPASEEGNCPCCVLFTFTLGLILVWALSTAAHPERVKLALLSFPFVHTLHVVYHVSQALRKFLWRLTGPLAEYPSADFDVPLYSSSPRILTLPFEQCTGEIVLYGLRLWNPRVIQVPSAQVTARFQVHLFHSFFSLSHSSFTTSSTMGCRVSIVVIRWKGSLPYVFEHLGVRTVT